jgi:hypothetical protein
MAYDDFWNMTPREFANALEGYRQRKDRETKEMWEQTRVLASLIYNKPVYGYKIKHLDKEKLLSFPWDSETKDFSEEIENIKEHRKWLEQHIG